MSDALEERAPRILLVDDEPLLTMLIGDLLSEFGCEVVGPADSVEAALALIESEGSALDGALLDVALRKGDSYPIADLLGLRGVPYAFVTGHGVGGLAPAFRNCLTLAKPFTPDDLQEIVTRLVSLRGR